MSPPHVHDHTLTADVAQLAKHTRVKAHYVNAGEFRHHDMFIWLRRGSIDNAHSLPPCAYFQRGGYEVMLTPCHVHIFQQGGYEGEISLVWQ